VYGEPERELTVRCRRCRGDVVVAAFIVDTARQWMQREFRRADQGLNRAPDVISNDDLVACEGCVLLEAEERRVLIEQEAYTTDTYRIAVKSGSRDPRALNWLREHGLGKWVDKILEGDSQPPAAKKPPTTPPKKKQERLV
jgi:hypothetical protein